tara:strand:- start:504 stop:860 length:357 start_codon:yes stop_codon:yes gene_type:complete
MKYILTALVAIFVSTSAYAESNQDQWSKGINVPNNMVKWFASTQIANAQGPGNKIKPYGVDKVVINPHIKDWFVPVEMKDANGNIVGIQQVYSHSIVRFTDANGQTFNISFHRSPVIK